MTEPTDQNFDNLEDYAQKRLAICKSCPEYKMMICMKCGCFMPAKTRLKGAECPIGKWMRVES